MVLKKDLSSVRILRFTGGWYLEVDILNAGTILGTRDCTLSNCDRGNIHRGVRMLELTLRRSAERFYRKKKPESGIALILQWTISS